jgi:hypothetical protein
VLLALVEAEALVEALALAEAPPPSSISAPVTTWG